MENTSNYKKYVFIVLVLSLVSFGSINLHKAFQQEPLPQMIKSPSINRPLILPGKQYRCPIRMCWIGWTEN